MTGDLLPTILGLALVAAAAAFALVPFARGTRADVQAIDGVSTDRFVIYRRVLELEFDYEMGKLAAEDYATQSAALLSEASAALHAERGSLGQIDEEIEREIGAARTAFAAVRRPRRARKIAGVGS